MNVLAEAVLDYFIVFIFAGEGIDADYAEDVWQSFPQYVTRMTTVEKQALSDAASARIAYFQSGPDEHGYDPGLKLPNGLMDFLELVKSGEIYKQWS